MTSETVGGTTDTVSEYGSFYIWQSEERKNMPYNGLVSDAILVGWRG